MRVLAGVDGIDRSLLVNASMRSKKTRQGRPCQVAGIGRDDCCRNHGGMRTGRAFRQPAKSPAPSHSISLASVAVSGYLKDPPTQKSASLSQIAKEAKPPMATPRRPCA